MGKQKGCIKTGGRARGTPNKVTSTLKEFIAELIDSNREQIEKDIRGLKPFQRLAVLERLFSYVIPKQQAVSYNEVVEAEIRQLERLIDTLPDEAIDRITAKIMELQYANRDEQQGTTKESD